jgi:hypothetical protein
MASRVMVGVMGLTFLLFSGATHAQNLEVFALDDFVEPELLEFPSDDGVVSAAFLTSKVQFGFVENYQRLSTPTEEDLFFLRVSNNFYYKSFQGGVKVTVLEEPGDQRAYVVADRLTLEGGYYFKTKQAVEDQAEPLSYTNRVRVSWDQESLSDGEVSSAFNVALDLTADVFKGVMSGYNYTWREGAEEETGHDEHYLSANSRFPVKKFSNDSRIWMGMAIGAERTLGHTRWGAARLELALDAPLNLFNTRFRFVYSPSYQFDRGEYNQEISVFLNPPVFGRFFGIPGSEPPASDNGYAP